MKKKTILILIFFSLKIFSQKEAHNWYFGTYAGLNFSTFPPTVLNNGKTNTEEGCSSISDKNGNLLFYSDGTTVWDRNHKIMKYFNGRLADNLKGDPSSSQSALIVPHPVNINLYYIFTVGGLSFDRQFNYYTIDMSKNFGNGEMIDEANNLTQNTKDWTEKLTAIEGKDCNSFWVLSLNKTSFISYKVDENGVDAENPIYTPINYKIKDVRGYLKISPNGEKAALADFNAITTDSSFSPGEGRVVLIDFDSSTGKLFNEIVIIDSKKDGAPYGIEFSQDSRKLYVTTFNGTENTVLQFDLNSNDISSSQKIIHKQKGYRGALQLASDGRIYLTNPIDYFTGTSFIDVIPNPNQIAENVKYIEDFIDLGNGISTQGLPPFIQSFFLPTNIVDSNNKSIVLSNNKQFICNTETLTMEPGLNDSANATYRWTKEDSNIELNDRTITIREDIYGSGTYNLEVTYKDKCERIKRYNSSVVVEFSGTPNVNTLPVYVQCDIDNNPIDYLTFFNLKSLEEKIYTGKEEVEILFFEINDINFTNPILKENYINLFPTSNNNHTIVAKIFKKGFSCFETIKIELQVNPSIIISFGNIFVSELDENFNISESSYSKGTGNGEINFESLLNSMISNSPAILSNELNNFEFYLNEEDIALKRNRITHPFNNIFLKNEDRLYVKVIDKKTEACKNIGVFNVIVRKLPKLTGDINSKYLCLNRQDEIALMNFIPLSVVTDNILDSFKWYLNDTLIFGENNSTLNATKKGIYKVEASRKYDNSTLNLDDDITTIGYKKFTVKESAKALIETITVNDNQNILNEPSITINTFGKGDYEYSINSKNAIDFKKGTQNLTYTFKNVKLGLNKIYVKDINGCGITNSEEISVIFVQKFFTPNNDGIKDLWKVLGTKESNYKMINFKIFDRYGRFLKEVDFLNENGWNGISNGKKMPANDYWYTAILIDNKGNLREKKGNFSLLYN
jgi:gliding motility-associated-like protein